LTVSTQRRFVLLNFFFFFWSWVYCPRGLGPMLDITYCMEVGSSSMYLEV
jgi:hypothetical protein